MARAAAWLLVAAAIALEGVSPYSPPVGWKDCDLVIVSSKDADPLESLAAKEIRRYVYATTGSVCPIVKELPSDIGLLFSAEKLRRGGAQAIVVGGSSNWTASAIAASRLKDRKEGGVAGVHTVRTVQEPGKDQVHVIVCTGVNDSQATLYAAYTFVEHVLGVQFMLHGDVLPRRDIGRMVLPTVAIDLAPEFRLRGLQPFHDFASGPDWWTLGDFKAVLSQMLKQKMNFVGFHSYPMGEPLLWVGDESDLTPDGDVLPSGAYATTWRTTNDSGWGHHPRMTSRYVAGARLAFPRDCYGSEIQAKGCVPQAEDKDAQAKLFNDAADMFADVLKFAGHLGIKRALGTEIPLLYPQKEEPDGLMSPRDTEAAFRGAFKRLMLKGMDIDYYWHWTDEDWEWGKGGVNTSKTAQMLEDIQASIRARNSLGAPFELATCGWMVGPWDDPTYFDRMLDGNISALSSIGKHLGWDAVQAEYGNITQHEKWFIPWMEDDPGLIGTELWVNRTIEMSREAHKLGVQGLMGIHWRTLETSLTVSALAKSTWNLSLRSDDLYDAYMAVAFEDATISYDNTHEKAAEILKQLDSFQEQNASECWMMVENEQASVSPECQSHLPRPNFTCCAAYHPSERPGNYSLMSDFLSLRAEVFHGSRKFYYDQWSRQFEYHRHIGRLQVLMWQLEKELDAIEEITDRVARTNRTNGTAIPLLADISRTYEDMMTTLLAFVHTPGELGMIAQQEGINWLDNMEPMIGRIQRSLLGPVDAGEYLGCYDERNDRSPVVVSRWDFDRGTCSTSCAQYPFFGLLNQGRCFCGDNLDLHLRGADGAESCNKSEDWCISVFKHQVVPDPIPDSAYPTSEYLGAPRLFVMPERTLVSLSEKNVTITAVALAREQTLPESLTLLYRNILEEGSGDFLERPMPRVARGRGWYQVTLDLLEDLGSQDFEYKVVANLGTDSEPWTWIVLTYPKEETLTATVHDFADGVKASAVLDKLSDWFSMRTA